MKILRLLPYVFASALLLAACTSHPVYNIQQEYIPLDAYGEKPLLEEVELAIIKGAQRRGWSPRKVSPGLIEASISVRRHNATVEIPFTEEWYGIRYKDSHNLDYKNGQIHRNYNNWVIKLSRTIQDQFGVNTQKY